MFREHNLDMIVSTDFPDLPKSAQTREIVREPMTIVEAAGRPHEKERPIVCCLIGGMVHLLSRAQPGARAIQRTVRFKHRHPCAVSIDVQDTVSNGHLIEAKQG